MVLTKEQIKDELKILNSAVNDNGKSIQDGVTVEFFFEYTEDGHSKIEQFRYARATVDERTQAAMVARAIKTFSSAAVDEYDLEPFNILKRSKDTFSYSEEGQLSNADEVIKKLEDVEFSPEEDLSVLGKLDKVKGAIVKVTVPNDNRNDIFYLFVKVETFNQFKRRNMNLGFMANVDNNGVHNITDSKTTFGVKDTIGFYYHDSHFLISNHSDFERMLFLISEYQRSAEKKADELVSFSTVLENVDALKSDLEGRGSVIMARMMARISIDDLRKKFSDAELDDTLKSLNDIITDERFERDFEDLTLDINEKKIYYTSDTKFKFVALLADRPAKTIFLGRKFME
ncbi:Kiwa anti-phage protein KwaB-like domain-containing protein [Lactiplantibacillus plantarum]|uniref:Kiwa anti-phage protein KwaB-like domain-containing protein n=1 Tax=Lactiplantibacillus plantarum TaxID=1590 RepID=UPI0008636AA9|nr:Kiwa anti-phage protein KwaB-like domain-containing protein [Lactiplantibacillus plantarum]UQB62038.1 DUF4868 domain-containing protein [Lactiplantibacillus plantarum]